MESGVAAASPWPNPLVLPCSVRADAQRLAGFQQCLEAGENLRPAFTHHVLDAVPRLELVVHDCQLQHLTYEVKRERHFRPALAGNLAKSSALSPARYSRKVTRLR
jgi:hypothetical protein